MKIKKYTPTTHKIKSLIYGKSWTWKTTFGATAKNVLFASAENGLLSVWDKNVSYVDIKTKKDFKDLQAYLKKGWHGFETLVIDSITEIADIIKNSIEESTWKKMQMQDWGTLKKELEDIIMNVKNLDMNVIIIAQEDTKFDDTKVHQIWPAVLWSASVKLTYTMDIVGYIGIDKDWERKIITSPNERLFTKDRTWKIWNDTPVDFEEWIKKVKDIKIKEQEEVIEDTQVVTEEQFKKYVDDLNNASEREDALVVFKELNAKELTSEQNEILEKVKKDLKAKFKKDDSNK